MSSRSGEKLAKYENFLAERGPTLFVIASSLIILIFPFSHFNDGFWTFLALAGIGIVLSGAAFFVGALIGFLFGIPRLTLSDEDKSPVHQNANLVEISDWLTKILVGFGLAQLTQIQTGVYSFSLEMQESFKEFAGIEFYSVSLIVYWLVAGFFSAYLFASILLPPYVSHVRDELDLRKEAQGVAVSPIQVGPSRPADAKVEPQTGEQPIVPMPKGREVDETRIRVIDNPPAGLEVEPEAGREQQEFRPRNDV